MSRSDVETFCAEVRPRLVGSLALYCGDAAVAEEIAQETLARVWANWSRVSTMASPAAWAHRVALNLARSHVRRVILARRVHGQLTQDADHVWHDRDQALIIDVRRAVASLPSRQRAALVLRYYVDLPVNDVAEIMRCRPGTIKALTHRAITALRQQLPEAANDQAASPTGGL